MGREGWAAAIIGSIGQEWDVERRFRVTEVALAIMWVRYMNHRPGAYHVLSPNLDTDIRIVQRLWISFLFFC